jgi:hypothetical protein
MSLTKRTVTIKPVHAAKGKRNNCAECPGALAILEVFTELSWVDVKEDFVMAYTPYEDDIGMRPCPAVRVPGVLREYFTAFDAGENPATPVSFELELYL